jgi:hypothetical protein
MTDPPVDTYIIVHRLDGHAGIFCKLCGLVSWHPEDIKHLYCGRCSHFHADHLAIPKPPATLMERVQSFLGKRQA